MHGIHDRNKRKHEYHGETDAEPLIEWLNRVASKKDELHCRMGLDRVLGIKEAILRLQEKAQKMISDGTWQGKSKALKNDALSLNAKLLNYEFAYALDWSKQPIAWSIRTNEDLTSEIHLPKETIAILHVIELAKLRLLDKVRRCDCGMYFFARLPAQRFHSALCRVRFWELSAERKKRRREKAREYYYLHKSGKVR